MLTAAHEMCATHASVAYAKKGSVGRSSARRERRRARCAHIEVAPNEPEDGTASVCAVGRRQPCGKKCCRQKSGLRAEQEKRGCEGPSSSFTHQVSRSIASTVNGTQEKESSVADGAH